MKFKTKVKHSPYEKAQQKHSSHNPVTTSLAQLLLLLLPHSCLLVPLPDFQLRIKPFLQQDQLLLKTQTKADDRIKQTEVLKINICCSTEFLRDCLGSESEQVAWPSANKVANLAVVHFLAFPDSVI